MYSSDHQIKSSDLLNLKQVKGFGCLLHEDEEIILSSQIMKYNRQGKCQERILVLTNKSILNIAKNSSIIKAFMKKFVHFEDKYDLRRRIQLSSVYGITLTPNRPSNSFLLHVIKDHDYYYKAIQNKMFLLQAIANQYQIYCKKPLPFYFREEKELLNFCTFKNHLKQKKDRKPKDDPNFLNHQYFRERDFQDLDYQIEYLGESQEDSKIRPKDFLKTDINHFKPNKEYYVFQEESINFIKVSQIPNLPFLLRPTFCFYNSGKQLLFRPFLQGGSLKNFIQNQLPLERQSLLFFFWQLILIVEQLLSIKKVYLNLTLQNILVKENGYIVLDGFQKLLQDEPGKLFLGAHGNPYYFSPEIITFEGCSSDELLVWKLGVCAYYLFRGKYPFTGGNIKELYQDILYRQIDQKDSETPSFIVKMLNKDKSKRITLSGLKNQDYFEGYNWKALVYQKIKCPLKVDPKAWNGKVPAIYELKREQNNESRKQMQKSWPNANVKSCNKKDIFRKNS